MAHVQGLWEYIEVVGAQCWRVHITANKLVTHPAPAIMGVCLWLPGSAPAGATLALVCAVHAALGSSILQFEEF
jgi:hypothetical protein